MADGFNNENPIEWIKLISVFDNLHFAIIKGLLETAEIPVVRGKSHGLGSYAEILTGVNYEGIDILVPADRYEEASDLIREDTSAEDSENSAEDSEK